MRPIYFRAGFLALAITMLSRAVVGQESLGAQLSPEYQRWLDEDVHWIITSQEGKEFLKLASDQARDQFVIDFWKRRNPTPGGKENPFKEEHYRRLAFSNEHFAAGIPGWKTDRGKIYVIHGAPDSIAAHPSTSEGPPNEVWRYHHMNGGGDDVTLKFVDSCYCGDYRLQNEPSNNE
jgi:GWxTD domain-containing protein